MIERLLLTGAGGRLGSYLREPLSRLCTKLVSTDIKSKIGPLYKNEKFVFFGFLISSIGLFIVGICFAFYIIINTLGDGDTARLR